MAEAKESTLLNGKISEEQQEQLVEMLPVFLNSLSIVKMMGDTMTDSTVQDLAQKAEKAADLLEYIGDERITNLIDSMLDKSDQLIAMLDKVIMLQENGSLDKLLQLGEALGVVTDSLTEQTITDLTTKGVQALELGDKVAQSSLVKNAPKMLDAVEQTVDETKDSAAPTMGLFQMLKLMKQKEVQEALHFGTTLLKNINTTK